MQEIVNYAEQKSTIKESIGGGIEYLLGLVKKAIAANILPEESFGKQSSAGPSTERVSACIGSALLRVIDFDPEKTAEVKKCVNYLAKKLIEHQGKRKNGGWGYNEKYFGDADSTARTIEFLEALQQSDYIDNDIQAIIQPSIEKGVLFIKTHQKGDEGFTTYNPEAIALLKKEYTDASGRGESHICVTSTVIKVLQSVQDNLGIDSKDIIQKAKEYLHKEVIKREHPHGIKAYWRKTILYVLHEIAKIMPDYYKERIKSIAQKGNAMSDSVELGLFLHILVNANHEDWKTVQRLINLQKEDGSFQASSELLVPRPHVKHKDLHKLGYHTKTMSDTDRTLSTSSAIVGLYRYLQYLQAIESL